MRRKVKMIMGLFLSAALMFPLCADIAVAESAPEPAAASGTYEEVIEIYRLYNRSTGEHFYTGNRKERNALRRFGWVYEGVGWVAPGRSDTPVYRLYNR